MDTPAVLFCSYCWGMESGIEGFTSTGVSKSIPPCSTAIFRLRTSESTATEVRALSDDIGSEPSLSKGCAFGGRTLPMNRSMFVAFIKMFCLVRPPEADIAKMGKCHGEFDFVIGHCELTARENLPVDSSG